MKGQSEHRRHIMGVQPTALPFAEPQHEEISKDLLVRDDARQDGDQHEHRGGTDEITRPEDRNIMQVEMEAVQEETTGRVKRMDPLSITVERSSRVRPPFPFLALLLLGLPDNTVLGIALRRRTEERRVGKGCVSKCR